jgi:hypothetical protein
MVTAADFAITEEAGITVDLGEVDITDIIMAEDITGVNV